MKTTKGKVTTAKSQFIALAREVNRADSAVVLAWLAVFRTFLVSGTTDKQAFARAFVSAVRGTAEDKFTENTVRQNVSLIEWAEQNIIGGARKCLSMNAIAKQRGGSSSSSNKGKEKVVASAVTLTRSEVIKRLKDNGFTSAEAGRIATALNLR